MSHDPVEWTVKLRLALMRAVTEDDMREIGQQLVASAKRGDRGALATLLSLLQPPPQSVRQIGPINVTSGSAGGKRGPKVVPLISGNGEG